MNEKASQEGFEAPETAVTHLGRTANANHPFVNPPVVRASTVLFDSIEDMSGHKTRYTYGRRGTPTSEALEDAIASLEGAEGTVVAPSGLAAITVALLSFLSSGDHALIADTAYYPTREVSEGMLRRLGIDVEYYDPRVGAGIETLIRPNTRVIYLESPGSLTFEMQDVPAITAVARARGITTIMDNTWATPLYYRPIEHGVDVVLHAATKYIVGHSDAMLGVVSAGPSAWKQLKLTHGQMGMFTGPDDMWLGLRGLRTMAVRLQRHQENALKVATWLETRPEVSKVLYPALPSHPDHALWKRDFGGASGLFAFVLGAPYAKRNSLAVMLDGLQLFGRGYSWGGFESLAIVSDPSHSRSATRWSEAGPLIRVHIGLENVDELIADLEAGFDRLNASIG